MKRLILAVLSLGVMAGLAFHVSRTKAPVVAPAEPEAESSSAAATAESQPVKPVATRHEQLRRNSADAGSAGWGAPAHAPLTEVRFAFNQAIETLVSRQATYDQRQAAWKQLKDTGKLDQAIAELEQRMAGDAQTAEYPAALGQAYLQKCAVIQDVREQAILAMKADQAFDAALSLDPSNWEARFTKAVAMSYWPASLNKGQEVIDHFQTLIQQQETQPPQPQFAQSYVWLGNQYQKAGNPDYARQIWQRGADLFPNNEDLKQKLAPAP